jgi:hypothetical protein
MKDEKYLQWKQDNNITSLWDLDGWMNESVSDGILLIYLHEDNESYDLMMRYLDEMPVTRESAEEIMEAIEEGLDFLYYEDELVNLLKAKFMKLLTVEEIKTYIEE